MLIAYKYVILYLLEAKQIILIEILADSQRYDLITNDGVFYNLFVVQLTCSPLHPPDVHEDTHRRILHVSRVHLYNSIY